MIFQSNGGRCAAAVDPGIVADINLIELNEGIGLGLTESGYFKPPFMKMIKCTENCTPDSLC